MLVSDDMKGTLVIVALLWIALMFLVSVESFSVVKADVGGGVISIAFDDATQNQYDYAFPLLQQYGIPATFYAITSQISDFSGNNGYMSIAELQTLQNNGNEVGSHSVTHRAFTGLTDSQIVSECVNSKALLESYGLLANNFAYPYGQTNDHVNSIVTQYFRSARSAYTGPYILSLPLSQSVLPAYPGESGDTSIVTQLQALQTAESMVDQIVSSNGYGIIFFHNVIPGDTTDAYEISQEYFASFLQYVAASGVQTLTVNQALDIGQSALSASISPSSMNLAVGDSPQLFSSTVTGGVSPYSYQWSVNSTNVSGADDSTWYFVPSSAGTYKVNLNVIDSYGDDVQSNTATVLVKPLPTVTISPTQVRLMLGQSQTFSSLAVGGFTPYTYHWCLNGTAVSGGTSSNWTFTPAQTGHFSVYLNVTDNLNHNAQSNIVNDILVSNQLTVSISPTSSNMTVGGLQQFNSTVAGGFVPYSYQWYYGNGSALAGSSSSILGYMANSTGTFSIYLNVTDSSNNKIQSNIASVNVNPQATVTISPVALNMTVGTFQTFSSTVSNGTSPYSYQWYLNGTQVSGATGGTWIFNASSAGTYLVFLRTTDSYNITVQSNNATVKVENPMNVTVIPGQVKMYVAQSLTFNSSVSGGTVPFSYQWYLNGTAVAGATSSSWTFMPKTAGDFKVYVRVTDGFGFSVNSNVTDVLVCSINLMLTPVSAQSSFGKGQSVTLTVDVFNQNDPAFASSLTLTISGPNNYGYFDVQPVNVAVGGVKEYSFNWVAPSASGTYVVSVGLAPAQLTAYDEAWLKVT